MRVVRDAVGWSLLAVLLVSPARAALRDRFSETARLVGIEGGSAFDALGDAIADAAARNLPIISASAGFTYRYNPKLEVFERTSDTLGPLFLERPDTLGRGKLNVNVSVMYVELNELDGTPTNKLEGPFPVVIRQTGAGGLAGFSADRLRYNFKLINHIAGLSVTYGVLDDLDVNLLVPVISTDFDVTANAQTLSTAGPDRVFSPAPGPERHGPLHGHENGVGDILLRAKYQLAPLGILRHAAGLQLRLPSGDRGKTWRRARRAGVSGSTSTSSSVLACRSPSRAATSSRAAPRPRRRASCISRRAGRPRRRSSASISTARTSSTCRSEFAPSSGASSWCS